MKKIQHTHAHWLVLCLVAAVATASRAACQCYAQLSKAAGFGAVACLYDFGSENSNIPSVDFLKFADMARGCGLLVYQPCSSDFRLFDPSAFNSEPFCNQNTVLYYNFNANMTMILSCMKERIRDACVQPNSSWDILTIGAVAGASAIGVVVLCCLWRHLKRPCAEACWSGSAATATV